MDKRGFRTLWNRNEDNSDKVGKRSVSFNTRVDTPDRIRRDKSDLDLCPHEKRGKSHSRSLTRVKSSLQQNTTADMSTLSPYRRREPKGTQFASLHENLFLSSKFY